MGDPTARRKAFKLKPIVTRDSFLLWDLNHKSFCRQEASWLPFLPGGTRSTWNAFDEDETRGISVYKIEAQVVTNTLDEVETNKARNALEEFLVCLGTYCPDNFMHTVVNESTSYSWVLEKIKATFNLNTKGLGFLAGGKLKVEYGEEGQTLQQGFQVFKEFYASSLLKKGDKFRGKVRDSNEPLTPLAENMIVEKWIDSVDPDAKEHIMQTRGNLFTEERPSLAENQQQICEQMPAILQELEAKRNGGGPLSVNRTGFNQPGQRSGFTQPGRRPPFSRRPGFASTRPPSQHPRTQQYSSARMTSRPLCPPDTCVRCYDAGRLGPATKNHFVAQCPHPPNRPRSMKVLFMPTNQSQQFQSHQPQPQQYQSQQYQSQQYQPSAQIQEIQLSPSLLSQEDPAYADHEEQGDDYDNNWDYANDAHFMENTTSYHYDKSLVVNPLAQP